MAFEIKEIVISMNILGSVAASKEEKPPGNQVSDRELLIRECVRRVLDAVNESRGR